MTIDLTTLATPRVIETVSYASILDQALADLKERFLKSGITYDVGNLETDPAKILVEVSSAREIIIRQRINDAAKANLIAYASGSDLDHLAAFYDVTRLAGENDIQLRARVVLAIQARSPGGSSYWYKQAALRADTRIKDVVVYREMFWPIIHVAVLSSQDGGVPDKAMLDAVTAEIMSDRVRLLNDTIIVEAAVTQTVDVAADIWLLPDASSNLVTELEGILRKAWQEESGVGFDLEISWLESRLHIEGVKKVVVTSPSASIINSEGSATALGTITLTNKGRDY
ncbi:baseplate J/gp47 family protein [Brucella sp.]|uniref:baseplate J/gp47 family protein n=1 Tax=Brucella sp. TaxID=52132 RepID=UPI0028A9DC3F|nr:baseplate J/gp47 family protein [Brucella sp.]